MGCASTFDHQEHQGNSGLTRRETLQIEFLNSTETMLLSQKQQTVEPTSSKSCDQFLRQQDRKVIQMKEQRIEFLKQNKLFVDKSIEACTCVKNALISISSNPYIQDRGFSKLIGMNQKTLIKKQNRFNNLAKRQEKAEFELQKEKERAQGKAQAQLFKSPGESKFYKKFKVSSNKQNKSQSAYNYIKTRQKLSQKLNRIDLFKIQSQSHIE